MKRPFLILCLLYLAFISLGLPDAVLGAAWPKIRESIHKGLEYGGFLLSFTTVVSVCSSLSTGYALKKFNTGQIVALSASTTALAMFGYSLATNWSLLILFTLFFGIGQGAVDTAVNSYMAKNYSARHMNWVHCCWGIGATSGPLIMAAVLSRDLSWRSGYLVIGLIQTCLAFCFFSTLAYWKITPQNQIRQSNASSAFSADSTTGASDRAGTDTELPGNRLVKTAAAGIAFYLCYPGIEVVAGLWGASYLVEIMGTTAPSAGIAITLYWASLTVGRFLSGFAAGRISNANIIRLGIGIAFSGSIIVSSGLNPLVVTLGMMLTGFGISPLYPTMMHDAPARVGKNQADRLIGFQVGASMAGTAIIPALAGMIAACLSLAYFGYILLFFILLLFLIHEFSIKNSLLNPEQG